MKKYLLFLTVGFLLVAETPTTAQVNGGITLAERATTMTWRIAERVQLSEGQFVKLRQLNVLLLTETADLRRQHKANSEGLDRGLAALQLRYEWDVAALLQPKQLAVYDGMRAEFTAANIH